MKTTTFISAVMVVACATIAAAQEPDSMTNEQTREIRVQRVITAPVDDVWESWTTGEGFEAMTGAAATIEPVPGGEFFIRWVPDAPEGERGSEGCEVLAAHHKRMLSFSWNAPPQFPNVREKRTTVTVYFDAEGPDRTRLTLYNHGYPPSGHDQEWDEVFEYFSKAWPTVMGWCGTHHAKERGVEEIVDPRPSWMYVPSPARDDFFTNPDEAGNAKVGEHFLYLQEAIESGRLVLAGPCTDFKGPAVVIFQAGSEAEARKFMENDPAVKSGVFNASLHPMSLSLLRERDGR